MAEFLTTLLVLATALIAVATYHLVRVNRRLLNVAAKSADAATKSADAATKSADAATAAAESAAKHAELTEQHFYMSHKSYIRLSNLIVSDLRESHDKLWLHFDVVDAIGVPTYVKEVRAQYWFGNAAQPPAGTDKAYVLTEVFRGFSYTSKIDIMLKGFRVSSTSFVYLDATVIYDDTSRKKTEQFTERFMINQDLENNFHVKRVASERAES